ncbi:hypothetical protein TFLX_00115 [Thermoflexales bacterium]|nr:hypothetical protein TFLX_00115 [Thermoflexales bacterium]
MPKLIPQHFIGEAIEVIFDRPPTYEKKPPCPNGFVWQGQTYRIVAELEAWNDYERKGRMATNMRPAHAEAAAGRGSWGVGRFYFRVRVAEGRLFELYYDRAPRPVARRGSQRATDPSQDAKQRKGAWFLQSELNEE